MRIGIVGGALKPVTKGHWALIRRASQENDTVRLLVSDSDRNTKGEGVTIKGSDMREIWARFLVQHLPANVRLEFVPNPVRAIYELLGEANDSGCIDEFSVYSDPNDILDRFAPDKQKKYFGGLVDRSQVRFVGIDRTGDMDVSGTQARVLLQHGMRDAFIQLLPVDIDRAAVWDYLLLKCFVRQV